MLSDAFTSDSSTDASHRIVGLEAQLEQTKNELEKTKNELEKTKGDLEKIKNAVEASGSGARARAFSTTSPRRRGSKP